ncbi:MAG TPA: PRC-barrel domain-containing protein [Candidatus Nanoarchaeia archaeon]|nr:PRC-barrel domain-containing protein [Candidatus Nanoarchaeia archaeon]
MRVKKISEVLRARVFTDSGDYFGEIDEVNLSNNKIDGWRIKVDGSITSIIGGAKGVIIPHNFVKAISDVFIISKSALPTPNTDFMAGPDSGDLE